MSSLWPRSTELEDLNARFPEWAIERDNRTDPPRLHAVARDLKTSLHSVVTSDMNELVVALMAAQERLGASTSRA